MLYTNYISIKKEEKESVFLAPIHISPTLRRLQWCSWYFIIIIIIVTIILLVISNNQFSLKLNVFCKVLGLPFPYSP